MKHLNALCGHNIHILNMKEGGIYSFRSERTAKTAVSQPVASAFSIVATLIIIIIIKKLTSLFFIFF
jgi:hypothetical protein